MNSIKRLLSFVLVLMATTGAWALEQDDEGYYLIGSVQDWQDFATKVQSTPTANARMTADINLGDDQTMIGTEIVPFAGTFDGQRHKLTIAYSVTENYVAPFRYVSGVTIQDLYVAGTISTTANFAAGVAGHAMTSPSSFNRCSSSVRITARSTSIAYGSAYGYNGGILARGETNNSLTDCLWDGHLDGSSSSSDYSCGLVGLQLNGTPTATNCLVIGTFENVRAFNSVCHGNRNATNTFFLNSNDTYSPGTRINADQLASGAVAYSLQNGRSDLVWGQIIGTDEVPKLTDDENCRVIKAGELYGNGSSDEDEEFTYIVSSSKIVITGYNRGTIPSSLVIPATINGMPVIAIDKNAFNGQNSITSLTLPEGLERIGDYAFYECTNLVETSMSSTVNYIGTSAFSNTDHRRFSFPSGVTELSEAVLAANTHLTDIVIEGNVTIDSWALSSLSSLKTITFTTQTTPPSSDGYISYSGPSPLPTIYVPYGGLWGSTWSSCPVVGFIKYTVPLSGLGTFSASSAVTLPEGLDAYYCKNYDAENGTIGVTAIDETIPASTGVLLKGTADETYTIFVSAASPSAIDDNALVAVTDGATITQTDGDYTNFGLSGGVFKKVNAAGGTLKANRAYLHILTSALTPEALARGISLVWDEDVTGVNGVRSNMADESGEFYNLNGQRVNHPTKGIYIVNGKKVFIK